MGLLYCPRFIATNNSTGAILPGARLYTFDAVATTTPKATFADNALSVSNGPYVTADALGVFPPIFGASDDQYFMELRTPGGVVVDQFPFVAILGPDDTSVLLKGLGANGRFQVRGSAGVVQIETGNAEGDDVGGLARLGGWNGTQGDSLSVDYAASAFTGSGTFASDLSTAGKMTVAGDLKLGALDRGVPRALVRGALTGTGAVNVDLPLDSAYEAWEVHVRNLRGLNVSGWEPGARLSFDGGATFKTAAGDYQSGGLAATTTATVTAWATATYLKLVQQFSAATAADGGMDLILRITSKAGRETRVRCDFGHFNGSGAASATSGWWFGATNAKNYGKATNIRIADVLGNNIVLDYLVIGLP